MTRDEAILKVKRLYALAKSTTAGEAQAAIKAADRIVQEFRIAEAEVMAARGQAPTFGFDAEALETGSPPVWKQRLLAILSAHYGCKSVCNKRDGSWKPYGTETDRAMVAVQYDRVVRQINAAAIRACKGQGRTAANSFRIGMVVELARMLAEKEALPVSGSTALACLTERSVQADQSLRECFAIVGVHEASLPRSFDREAADRGRSAGRHLHLGEDLEGKTRGLLG